MNHKFSQDYRYLFYFALFNFMLHITTNGQYGFHRDELYFLDCAKHLSFGYADIPPLTPFFGRIAVEIFGESLRAVRFFPALAGALAVFFTGLMVREFNGGHFAQALAMIAVIISPVYLVSGTQFQTIPFDQLIWIICGYLLIRIINTNDSKIWLLIGLTIGIGFLNKYTMFILGLSVLVGLLLSRQRFFLSDRWLWLGVLSAFLIFLPNLVWQYVHHMPVFDHMQALSSDIQDEFSVFNFFLDQIIIFSPFNLPIWTIGISFYFSKKGKHYQMLVWLFIIPLVIFSFTGAKSYYLSPSFPILFAGGAVYLESLLTGRRIIWIKRSIIGLLVISFIITLPVWLPILPIEKSKQYGLMDIRYDYREMIGWEELVETVAETYHKLPESDQKITTVFTGNYGEAGAINHYRLKYGLPRATSGIVSYYLWGPNVEAEIYIVIGGFPEDYLFRYFKRVEEAGVIRNSFDIQNEEYNQPFYICRELKRPILEVWPELRHF